jgi:(E)-4-hydroxy-3-methylbut-2-enyl-diphosphate synthase
MFTDIGFTGGAAGYGMMYHAGKKTGKTDNDVMVDEIVQAVEERAELLQTQRDAAVAAE